MPARSKNEETSHLTQHSPERAKQVTSGPIYCRCRVRRGIAGALHTNPLAPSRSVKKNLHCCVRDRYVSEPISMLGPGGTSADRVQPQLRTAPAPSKRRARFAREEMSNPSPQNTFFFFLKRNPFVSSPGQARCVPRPTKPTGRMGGFAQRRVRRVAVPPPTRY